MTLLFALLPVLARLAASSRLKGHMVEDAIEMLQMLYSNIEKEIGPLIQQRVRITLMVDTDSSHFLSLFTQNFRMKHKLQKVNLYNIQL